MEAKPQASRDPLNIPCKVMIFSLVSYMDPYMFSCGVCLDSKCPLQKKTMQGCMSIDAYVFPCIISVPVAMDYSSISMHVYTFLFSAQKPGGGVLPYHNNEIAHHAPNHGPKNSYMNIPGVLLSLSHT
jgi:hypothetical protein